MADQAKPNLDLPAELRALQIELQEFRDYLPDAFLEVDIIALRLIYMNRMAYILFGYSEADFRRGIPLPDLFADQEYQRAFRDMTAFAAESMQTQTAYQRTGRQDLLEYRLRRKEGTTFPAETQIAFVLDENQIPIALRTFIRDISQSKTAEE
jgi:PAS domain S-box-containing protein